LALGMVVPAAWGGGVRNEFQEGIKF
jgi:hypothetical protein